MIQYRRTNSGNAEFQQLVVMLDAELRIRDGEEHEFYAQLNKTDKIKHVIVAWSDGVPVGCGAIREYDAETMEVKRMYVTESSRKMGIASEILKHLERWAFELKYIKCILETGQNQPEAIALYKKSRYRMIPNFGKYVHSANSVCFEKVLSD